MDLSKYSASVVKARHFTLRMTRRHSQERITPCQDKQLRLFGTGTTHASHEGKSKWLHIGSGFEQVDRSIPE